MWKSWQQTQSREKTMGSSSDFSLECQHQALWGWRGVEDGVGLKKFSCFLWKFDSTKLEVCSWKSSPSCGAITLSADPTPKVPPWRPARSSSGTCISRHVRPSGTGPLTAFRMHCIMCWSSRRSRDSPIPGLFFKFTIRTCPSAKHFVQYAQHVQNVSTAQNVSPPSSAFTRCVRTACSTYRTRSHIVYSTVRACVCILSVHFLWVLA